jgi:NTE family protein
MTDASALESPALGTSSDDFIAPCEVLEPGPSVPPEAVPAPGFAVALSGGGFRATLCGLGAVRFLAEAGLLSRLRYCSSVSGGSIANGLLASGYSALASAGFTGAAFDAQVIAPLIRRITRRSLQRELLRHSWRALGRANRTELLAKALDDWWFEGRQLGDLPAGVRWIFNAANIYTGVGFAFERDRLGDYVLGHVHASQKPIRLALAAAASAAVPGAFAPTDIDAPFPCRGDRRALLLDGGAYDNSGLQPLEQVTDACLVAVNAGGTFRVGHLGKVPVVRDLQRANAILYRQSTGLRRQMMVERFRAWEQARTENESPPPFARRGVLFGLGTSTEATDEWREGRPEHEEWRERLVKVATSFDRFDPELCRRLVYRGWWLTGATLSRFHRELLPERLPAWREPF